MEGNTIESGPSVDGDEDTVLEGEDNVVDEESREALMNILRDRLEETNDRLKSAEENHDKETIADLRRKLEKVKKWLAG